MFRSRYSALYCIHIAKQNFTPGYTAAIFSSSIIALYAILKCKVNIKIVEKLSKTKIDANKKLINFFIRYYYLQNLLSFIIKHFYNRLSRCQAEIDFKIFV